MPQPSVAPPSAPRKPYVLFGYRATDVIVGIPSAVLARLSDDFSSVASRHAGTLTELRPDDVFVLEVPYGKAPSAFRGLAQALADADEAMQGSLQWFAQAVEGDGGLAHS